MSNNGFTLIEMLIAVSLVLILTSVGIPMYNGYIKDTKLNVAKSNLRSIYLAEVNYFYENNKYYVTGTACGNHNESLIKDLFMGEAVISKDLFSFCVLKNNDGFIAKATGNRNLELVIDNMNNLQVIKKE